MDKGKPKLVQLDNEEIKRCITALFGALKEGGFNDGIAAAALVFMQDTFKSKGIAPIILDKQGNVHAMQRPKK